MAVLGLGWLAQGRYGETASTLRYFAEEVRLLRMQWILYGFFFYYFLYLFCIIDYFTSSYFLERRLCRPVIMAKSVPVTCSSP